MNHGELLADADRGDAKTTPLSSRHTRHEAARVKTKQR